MLLASPLLRGRPTLILLENSLPPPPVRGFSSQLAGLDIVATKWIFANYLRALCYLDANRCVNSPITFCPAKVLILLGRNGGAFSLSLTKGAPATEIIRQFLASTACPLHCSSSVMSEGPRLPDSPLPLPLLIFGPERRLSLIERGHVSVALDLGRAVRHPASHICPSMWHLCNHPRGPLS
jgi:hypothetical protein